MKSLKNMKYLCIRMGMIIIFLFSSEVLAEPYLNEFEELCSEVITGKLENKRKKASLLDLYQKACFGPVWIRERALSQQAKMLFRLIREDQSLSHSSKLFKRALQLERTAQEVYAKNNGFNQKIELELEISLLYKKYAEYRLYGSIDWNDFSRRRGMWVRYKPKTTPASLLESIVIKGKSIDKAFLDAEPKEYHFKELKQALFSYLKLQREGKWKPISVNQTIRMGEENEIIPIIRERLRITGDDMQCPDEGNRFDACLKTSVSRFQKRHGLASDGVIGKRTVSALNRGLEERIALIKLNLDRIKWLNQRGDNKHIIVNIPAFTLYLEEDGRLSLQMKVITGKRRNRTPVFSNTVQQVVLNPAWNVPKNIIVNEMIPQLVKNPNAMAREGIHVYRGWGNHAQRIDPRSVDWAAYHGTKKLPFRFTQPPGRRNALGKVKFLFPNRFSVYMHDTPSKYLFDRSVRAFSHGCIRLEKPIEMLKVIASFNETLQFDHLQKRLNSGRRTYLKLDREVPVDVIYLTAWVDYDGVLQFRNDIYGYDKIQLSKMKAW